MKRIALSLTIIAAMLIPLQALAAGHTVSISSSTNVSCNGGSDGSATAAVSGGVGPFSYSWSPSGGTNATASGLAAGSYTVTATDSSDMSTATAAVTITEPPQLTVSTSSISASCFGSCDGTATMSASGGVSPYYYIWSDAMMQTTSTATALCAGTYTATVTDANGCQANAIAIVSEPTALTITMPSNSTICAGGSVTLSPTVSGGTPGYTYNWSPGTGLSSINTSNPTASPSTTTTYTFTVTDANACTATGTVTVTVNPLPTVSFSFNPTICLGGSVVLNPTVSGASTYSWSPTTGLSSATVANPTANPTVTTTYTLTVTSSAGCTNSASVTVFVVSLSVTTSSVDATCFGACNGSASTTVSGGNSPYNYSWSSGGQTTANISGLCAGSYTVTVTDANSCTATSSTVVSQPTQLTAITGSSSASCFNACDGTTTVTASGGVPPYNFMWSDPMMQQTSTAISLCAGTYTVTITDANACTATATATVTQPSTLSLSPSVTPVSCNGGNDGTASVTPSGGTTPYSYIWSTGATTQNISTLTAGSYSVTVTDANNCTQSATVSVGQPAALNATPSMTQSCISGCNGNVAVSVTGGTAPYAYLWQPVGASTAMVNSLCPGNYTVTVTDMSGCVTSATVTLTSFPSMNPVATATPDTICAGGTSQLTVTASGSVTYTWAPSTALSATNIANPIATPTTSTTYSVTVTDANGCAETASATVTVNPAPSVTTTSTFATCAGSDGTAAATVSGGTAPYTYSWFPAGGTNATATGLSAGSYTIIVTDSNSCAGNGFVAVYDSCGAVWPGDADENLVVDNNDVLAIGFAYGFTGPARPNALLSWTPQPAYNWPTTLPSGMNCKYTDTNGDGVIDNNDTLAIGLNYGNTHPFRLGAPLAAGSNPDLYLIASADSAGPQTMVTIDVMLGTTAEPIDSIYGIAFSISFDPALIDTSLTTIDYTGSWLGTQGVNMLPFSKILNSSGHVDVAIVGTDHANRSGSGKIATMKIVTTDNLSGITALPMNVMDVNAMRLSGSTITLDTAGDTLVIDPTGVDAIDLNKHVALYPNPASSAAILLVPGSLTENIKVIDITGRAIISIDQPSHITQLDLTRLAPGTYHVIVQTTKGNIYRKLNVIR